MSAILGFVAFVLVQLLFIARVLLRPHRQPASRIAWIVVIAAVPIAGMAMYVLIGETSIGRGRRNRVRRVTEYLPAPGSIASTGTVEATPAIPDRYTSLFRLGETINGFKPLAGNRAYLLRNSNATISSIVEDIDVARAHVHLSFYIWLCDNNGLRVVEALRRAASRGIDCRAMVDGLGSRQLINSKHWRAMRESGVKLGVSFPVGNLLLQPLRGRIDLRNHRKIVVIDNWITYCGSQNCADPEFLVKRKYAPWVDAVIRFEGPVALQNQHVFASDWMACVDEDISDVVEKEVESFMPGFFAQVIATGPTVRPSAAPEMFEALMYSARDRLTITTPYYVPNESLQAALCAAANRGVDTTIIFPARNDSFVVAAASRSYYRELLKAGVKIHEFVGGLLHSKSVTVDDNITLIGSSNIDRRSFELNFENNILCIDPELTADMFARQMEYVASSNPVSFDDVNNWGWRRRLWNNAVAMVGPLL
ncbi:cardiolipin synthase [Marinobacter sp. F4218]|uniref:cardiolipin synthase n=1 Tax=Marinobacter sp. F4218 TaxID=2862868 RepID=UPI001C62BE5A|nr:cardiolipin synthase [Marinobacter sp. F4218]MBW7472552.1 cardiolipin synthase [Marinobacter sp. F4218]